VILITFTLINRIRSLSPPNSWRQLPQANQIFDNQHIAVRVHFPPSPPVVYLFFAQSLLNVVLTGFLLFGVILLKVVLPHFAPFASEQFVSIPQKPKNLAMQFEICCWTFIPSLL